MSTFLDTFKGHCEMARKDAFSEGEQMHVVSFMSDNERVLTVISMRNLPYWINSNLGHENKKPCIHYSTPPNLLI